VGEKCATLARSKVRSCWRSQKRSWEDEVLLASLRCWQTAKWCVAKCATPFGPRCARVILFSTIANYCHSQKAVNKSLSCAVRGCRLLIQSQVSGSLSGAPYYTALGNGRRALRSRLQICCVSCFGR
jgi:hypothetical protein